MHRLGISLYPEHSTPDKDYAYMELAAMNGFSRIFTCLLSVEKNAEDTIAEFGGVVARADVRGCVGAVDACV